MKIERHFAQEFSLRFSRDDGWAIVMALQDAHDKYKEAADRQEWAKWADQLKRELQR